MPDADQLVSDLPPDERGIGVGVDLGTTNSAVAILIDGMPTIVPLRNNGRTIPSVVSFVSNNNNDDDGNGNGNERKDKDWMVTVGKAAIQQTFKNENNDNNADASMESGGRRTYRNVKRIMGMGGLSAVRNAGVVPNLLLSETAALDDGMKKQQKQKQRGRGGQKKKKKRGISEDGIPSLKRQLEEAKENPAQLALPSPKDEENGEVNDSKSPSKRSISPEEISAHVLRTLFDAAEDRYGTMITSNTNNNNQKKRMKQKVTRAVIGVPAYFNDAQREATIRACQLAGVPKVRLLREPEAAAMAYGLGKQQWWNEQQQQNSGSTKNRQQEKEMAAQDADELVLVFDLGGGTFDVSILEVGGGIMEVVATSGNNMLGGSDFDARIAQFMSDCILEYDPTKHAALFQSTAAKTKKDLKRGRNDVMMPSAEAVRIHLSNNRMATLALPLTEEVWSQLKHPGDIIVPKRGQRQRERSHDNDYDDLDVPISNSTHVITELSRQTMESLCSEEIQALLRPIREVAIMAGALLPGDASPNAVVAALEREEDEGEFEMELDMVQNSMTTTKQDNMVFDDFYQMDETGMSTTDVEGKSRNEKNDGNSDDVDPDTLLQLQAMDWKERKKKQQRGRKRARDLASSEQKFRAEKRRVEAQSMLSSSSSSGLPRLIDGIVGRPISRVVLVGGATRMPAIGRMLAAVTGIVPQKTVNPDEAVALGCAVQVGILDGDEALGGLQVLTPMQAALMRGLAKKRGLDIGDDEPLP